MKEFVFSFVDAKQANASKSNAAASKPKALIARFNGKNEDDAWNNLLKQFPDAQKIAGFPVDDELAKILDVMKPLDTTSSDEKSAQDSLAQKNALTLFKASVEDFKRGKKADAIEKKTLDAGAMEQSDWNALRSSLSPEELKEMYDEFMKDAQEHWKNDPKKLRVEQMFINFIFDIHEKGKWNAKPMTLRDMGTLLGVSHVRVLSIQKAALAKLMNNIAKVKHYPFKITSAEEAIAVLMADNLANPQKLHLKAKVNPDMSLGDALKKMQKMEVALKKAAEEKRKQNDKAYRKAYAEFKRLEKETNDIRAKLGLPKRYEQFFKFFKGQKAGAYSA